MIDLDIFQYVLWASVISSQKSVFKDVCYICIYVAQFAIITSDTNYLTIH